MLSNKNFGGSFDSQTYGNVENQYTTRYNNTTTYNNTATYNNNTPYNKTDTYGNITTPYNNITTAYNNITTTYNSITSTPPRKLAVVSTGNNIMKLSTDTHSTSNFANTTNTFTTSHNTTTNYCSSSTLHNTTTISLKQDLNKDYYQTSKDHTGSASSYDQFKNNIYQNASDLKSDYESYKRNEMGALKGLSNESYRSFENASKIENANFNVYDEVNADDYKEDQLYNGYNMLKNPTTTPTASTTTHVFSSSGTFSKPDYYTDTAVKSSSWSDSKSADAPVTLLSWSKKTNKKLS